MRLMIDIAALLEPGDLITLSGDLGAGKTTFARALIRHLAGDETIEVPSPTFTLMQTYELPRFALVHADLYRLSGPAELAELGFEDVAERGVVLLEWPDRAAGLLPADRLDIALTLSPQQGPNFRNARVTGFGTMAARVERIAVIRGFLDANGFAEAARQRIQGDASTRSYERLTLDGKSLILMNSPRRPDGPPVRDGKPYSAIAHLAESVTPFVAMAQACASAASRRRRSSPPTARPALLVIEDLGDEPVVAGDPPAPIEARYEVAVDVLVELHAMRLPETLPVEPGVDYRLPRYDMEAMLIEAELLLDWYAPQLNVRISDLMRKTYLALWRDALAQTIEDRADLGAARLPFAEFDVAAGAQRRRPHRAARFPGRGHRPAGLRSCFAAARCPRRRAGDDGDRAACRATPAPAAASIPASTPRNSPRSMPRSPPSVAPRFSAFSPASRPATASRNIYVTCRGYGATCSVRWRIRRWCRSAPGMPSTCRR